MHMDTHGQSRTHKCNMLMLNLLNVSRNVETNNKQPVSCEVVEAMHEPSCMRNIYGFYWGTKSMRKHVVIGPSCLWLLTKAAQRPERIKANSDLKKQILNDWEHTVSKMLHFYVLFWQQIQESSESYPSYLSKLWAVDAKLSSQSQNAYETKLWQLSWEKNPGDLHRCS